jgi:hypothetical protein
VRITKEVRQCQQKNAGDSILANRVRGRVINDSEIKRWTGEVYQPKD